MISTYTPPETYQQWLECFQYLQQHPLDSQMLGILANGRYIGQPAESYLVRLSDTVGRVLTCHCRRFLKQLDEAFADGEPDMAVLLALRLKKSIRKCLFYQALPFLSAEYVQTLDKGFGDQLNTFWDNFLKQLWRTARDSMDSRMEDVVLEMKRVKII